MLRLYNTDPAIDTGNNTSTLPGLLAGLFELLARLSSSLILNS